jgi:predicted secreted protein
MDHRSPITVDRSFNGKKVEVKVGDEIQIQLKGVGSTGYEWYFDLLDNNLFEITGKEKKIGARQGDVVGTPYVAIWKLRTKTPGSSMIKMSYYRVWEGRDKAIDQFEIHVDVTP